MFLSAIFIAAMMGVTGVYGPVTVTSCSLAKQNDSVAPRSLNLKYFNSSAKRTLTAVTFHVRYHGVDEHFVDPVGTLPPGSKVDHTLDRFGGVGWSGPYPAVCSVTAVRFADGQMLKI